MLAIVGSSHHYQTFIKSHLLSYTCFVATYNIVSGPGCIKVNINDNYHGNIAS